MGLFSYLHEHPGMAVLWTILVAGGISDRSIREPFVRVLEVLLLIFVKVILRPAIPAIGPALIGWAVSKDGEEIKYMALGFGAGLWLWWLDQAVARFRKKPDAPGSGAAP